MATEDNVVKLDPLERRARRIEAAITKRDRADGDWRGATLELAIELAGARDELRSDQAFGEWCQGRFDTNVIPAHERAILIRWGHDPTQTKIMLETEDSHSIRVIDRRFRNPTKLPVEPEPKESKAEKLNAALRHAQTAEAQTGKLPPEKDLAVAAGVSTATANEALQIIRHNRPEDIGRVQFTKATQEHIEAAMKRRLRELEKDFNERVRLQVLEENAPFREVLEKAKKAADEKSERYESLINYRNPIFNETEFTIILTCLHPDNVASKEKRDTAFKAFNAMKFQLTGKK